MTRKSRENLIKLTGNPSRFEWTLGCVVPVAVDLVCLLIFFVFQLVFTDKKHSKIYVTVDEGDSFTTHNMSFTPSIIKFHP